ncbi:MAG TPA: hypothetical protein VGM87_15635 [Roseomonas sp.]|jgi:hypothetical protein
MTTPSPPPAAGPGYLTEALRRAGVLGQGGSVAGVTVERVTTTILSHIFHLRTAYAGDADGAPAALVLKAGLPERPGGPWQGGRREVAFYRDVAPATPPGLLPRCFDAHWAAADGSWHLLLEDLTATHATATRWPLPPGLAQAEAIIRVRARFHAAWWDAPGLGDAIGTWPESPAADRQRLEERYAAFAGELGDRLPPERRAFYARLLDAVPRLAARTEGCRHMTIVQGDAHIWNCFLPRDGGGDARLFDWDAWRLDVATDDLAYMMATHWYPAQRRAAEQPLLDAYHAELLARGVTGYDRAALRADYRLSVLWQAVLPVQQHAMGIPPVIWWNNLERIHLAIEDIGCGDLLGR